MTCRNGVLVKCVALSGSEVDRLTPAVGGATASVAREGRLIAVATIPKNVTDTAVMSAGGRAGNLVCVSVRGIFGYRNTFEKHKAIPSPSLGPL